ncbi:hypothetical protein H4R34_003341 [Dimargaris verticillata]|uniref:Secreted protein n=1 Tax=Dimargaris verticillata TaxID=2761393 RepID=A0A9W8B110_9FUNG|nr:hypothetical protein H4R34_003341 [Dimargaris verticillata]
MARISLWLLATVAAVGLVHAIPMPETGRETTDASPAKTIPALPSALLTFIGLHTLLDGAQAELGYMVHKILKYLGFGRQSRHDKQDKFELQYPDLFPKALFRERAIPQLVEPWLAGRFDQSFRHDKAQHSLSKLGKDLGINYCFAVIDALFEVLKNPDLLQSFEAITNKVLPGQQGKRDIVLDGQASAATNPAPSQDVNAFIGSFWLKVIGNGDVKQLRYFLVNMLVFQIIPNIFRQMMDVNEYTDALKLAQQISKIPGFAWAVKACRGNAPNYFEHIMIHAACQESRVADSIFHDAKSAGNVDVDLVYKCLKGYESNSPFQVLKGIFSLEPPADPDAWQKQKQKECQPLTVKYVRFSMA